MDMASPVTASPALEARKSAIDTQAANAVAVSPEFIANLRLPPIPPSTPPLERKEIESRRKDLTGQLASAASRGDEAEYRRVMGQLNPQASELTIASSYGAARLSFLEKRQDLLMTECANTSGDKTANAYWMIQLSRNSQELFNLNPNGMATATGLYEASLASAASRIPGKPGTAEHDRRTEILLENAINAGFPAREAFDILDRQKIGDNNSSFGQDSIKHRLMIIAITRARELFGQCSTLYPQQETSDSAGVEFGKRYREFRMLTAGLLPADFDQGVLGRPSDHSAFLNDLQLHIQISANSVFVP